MNKLLQAATIALFATSMAHAQQAVQWRVEDGGNGHWYKKIQTVGVVSWTSAKVQAEALGGQLSCHETPAENQYVWQTAVQPTLQGWDAWIGLQRINGQWRWLSGPTTYTSWTFNSPDGDCGSADFAHFHQEGPTWNDLTENGIYCFNGGVACGIGRVCSFLVEWSADCNGDGIVDYGQILQGSLPDANGNGVPDACDQAQEPQGFLRFTRPTDTARIFGNTEFPGVDFTYEMRIRVDAASPLGRVISEQRDTYEDKSVWMSGSTFYGYMTRNQNCGNLNESAVSDIAGAWHHVAWTRNASVARLFVDGQPVAIWPSQYVCTGNSPDSLMAIGMIRYAYGCAEQASFRGDLDWIRVSRICRYAAPFLPPTECNAAADADTLLRLTFNDAPGSTSLVDSGPNHYQCELGAVGCGGPATAPTLIQAVTESGCRCIADINGDHAVTGADLGLIFVYWGPASSFPGADLNADGAINGADISVLLANWGPCAQ